MRRVALIALVGACGGKAATPPPAKPVAKCAVNVDRTLGDGSVKPIDAADWQALATAAPHEAELGEIPTEPPPTIFETEADGQHYTYVVVGAPGKLHARLLAAAMLGRCPGEIAASIAGVQNGVVEVDLTELDNDMVDREGGGVACFFTQITARHVFVDASSGAVLLVTTQTEEHAPEDAWVDREIPAAKLEKVTLGPNGVSVCGRVEKLR